MPRTGAHRLSELADDKLVAIACARCGRAGRYDKAMLVERFGPSISLSEVLVKLANCPRRGDMADPCRARLVTPTAQV